MSGKDLLVKERKMKVTEKVEVDAVTDVVCEVCLTSTRAAGEGSESPTLQEQWDYGTQKRILIHLSKASLSLPKSLTDVSLNT